jgi:hypothetical protein
MKQQKALTRILDIASRALAEGRDLTAAETQAIAAALGLGPEGRSQSMTVSLGGAGRGTVTRTIPGR